MTEPRLRADLESMPAYKAGATPKAKSGVSTFKISANENPYAPIPAIVEAINKAAQSVQRYPDPASLRLKTKLANKITQENILRIVSQADRSQLKNKEICIEKFYKLLEFALKIQKIQK